MTANNSSFRLDLEMRGGYSCGSPAVMNVVGFIVRLGHELRADEGFSSQSVMMASSCGAPTSTEDQPLGSHWWSASSAGRLDDHWLYVWSA